MRGLGAVLGVLLLALVSACGLARAQNGHPAIEPGEEGVFTFDGYPPLSDHPVRVFYDAPANPSTAEILVVMHGVGRNAEDYRADWEPLVADRNVLVLAPEFSQDDYPGHESYSLGNMTDDRGRPQPPERWSFQVIEALFDFVVRDVGSSARGYEMFGHSAGAQFVSRFIEFMPHHRVRAAVAANPGWYTMPDDSVPFPYGLDGSPVHERDLGGAFASNMVLLLGGDDTDPGDESLRHDARSDEQGRNRFERGQNYFRASREVAEHESLPFHWRLQVVPGVAHEHTDMARAAAPLLLPGGP